MKKPYIFFAAVLVVLILAFTFSSSYLNSLEKEAKPPAGDGVSKSEMEQFKQEVEQRIGETEANFLARLDSLEQRYRETALPAETATETTQAQSSPQSPSSTPSNTSAPSKPVASPATSVHQPATDSNRNSDYTPSEQEDEIYLKYLKRRWALAPDLTTYEMKIAKNEIMQDVGRQYNMSAEEVLQLIDRVYEFRKAKKQK